MIRLVGAGLAFFALIVAVFFVGNALEDRFGGWTEDVFVVLVHGLIFWFVITRLRATHPKAP